MQRILQSVNWGAPFGSEGRMTRTIALLGLDASHRPIGCPQRRDWWKCRMSPFFCSGILDTFRD
jgi:hypothetical protein